MDYSSIFPTLSSDDDQSDITNMFEQMSIYSTQSEHVTLLKTLTHKFIQHMISMKSYVLGLFTLESVNNVYLLDQEINNLTNEGIHPNYFAKYLQQHGHIDSIMNKYSAPKLSNDFINTVFEIKKIEKQIATLATRITNTESDIIVTYGKYKKIINFIHENYTIEFDEPFENTYVVNRLFYCNHIKNDDVVYFADQNAFRFHKHEIGLYENNRSIRTLRKYNCHNMLYTNFHDNGYIDTVFDNYVNMVHCNVDFHYNGMLKQIYANNNSTQCYNTQLFKFDERGNCII